MELATFLAIRFGFTSVGSSGQWLNIAMCSIIIHHKNILFGQISLGTATVSVYMNYYNAMLIQTINPFTARLAASSLWKTTNKSARLIIIKSFCHLRIKGLLLSKCTVLKVHLL